MGLGEGLFQECIRKKALISREKITPFQDREH